MATDITIMQMQEQDIEKLAKTFARWHKPRERFEKYFAEQQESKRSVLIAKEGETVIGYITLVWQSDYEPFKRQSIPEIVDLNVINEYQRQGIGTNLVSAIEQIARGHSKMMIGISAEQSSAYISANRMYPKLGYVPDGYGITSQDNELHLIKHI